MKRQLLISTLLGGLSLTMAVGLLGSSAWLIAMASTQPPILVLQVAIVSVRFFGLSRGVFRYGERVLSHDAILKAQSQLQVLTYRGLERAIPFRAQKSAAFFSAIVRDIELVQDRWLRIYIPWISAAIAGFAGIGAIYFLSHTAGVLIGTLFLFALFLLPTLTTSLSQRGSEVSYVDEVKITDQITNISRGFLEARIYGYTNHLAKSLSNTENSLAKNEKRIDNGTGAGSAINIFITGGAVIIGFVTSIHDSLQGTLGAVNIATLTLLPLMIFDGVGQLPSSFSLLGRIHKAEQGIQETASLPESNVKPKDAKSQVPTHFALELRSVRARWQEGALLHQPISALIRPGEPLLLEGESGVGKSSLALAIVGLLPHEGEILIGGQQIATLNCSEFITLSMQNDHLFNSSIRENIRIGNPNATDDQIYNLLDALELTELVNSLPEKLDTFIGTYGVNFSGGEKQRIRLARALVRDTPIYILDEPFEFLEKELAERISEKVNESLCGKTLIIISHDRLTIRNSVRIKLGVA